MIVSYSCNVLFPLVFNKCATISQTTLCSMQPAFIPLQIIYAFRCSLNLDVQIDILYIFYFGTKHTCANRTFITNYSHHCWGYQIFSPISNSESTKFVMISFSTGKLRFFFWPIRNLFSFSTAQTEKDSWTKLGKQIGENISWIRYVCMMYGVCAHTE